MCTLKQSSLTTNREPQNADTTVNRPYFEPINDAMVADPIVIKMTKQQLEKSIDNTTKLMKESAKNLDFIQAAQYRDEIVRLKKQLETK